MDFNSAVTSTTEAIRQGNCLPFVGAGVSTSRRYLYPTKDQWQQALNHLNNSLNDEDRLTDHVAIFDAAEKAAGEAHLINLNYEHKHVAPTWLLHLCLLTCLSKEHFAYCRSLEISTLADMLYHTNSTGLANILQHLFADKRSPEGSSDIHHLLALMSFQHIITTNYDGYIERAHETIGVAINTVAKDEDLLKNGLRCPLLIKLHGDFGTEKPTYNAGGNEPFHILNKIILTDSQYWSFPDPPGLFTVNGDSHYQGFSRRLIERYLRALIPLSRVVFLGYSLRDFNVIEIFHKLVSVQHKIKPPLLIARKTDDSGPLALWEGRGFQVVQCDLREFVEAVWECLYGPGISPQRLSRPNSPELVGDIRFEIPIKILLRRATKNIKFMENINEMARHNVFPERLLQEPDVVDRVDEFIRQSWLRKIESSNKGQQNEDSVFYQWAMGVRESLKNLVFTERL